MMRTSGLLQSVCEEIYGVSGGSILDTVIGKYLSDDDAKIVKDALELVGRSDINTQENQLTELIARLQTSLDSARSEAPVRRRLSLTLGTMAGLCLAIFLI